VGQGAAPPGAPAGEAGDADGLIRMSEGEWIRRGGEKKEKRRKKENKEKEKNKNRKGQFRHFTTSIRPVKPFCQTFPKRLRLHQKSRSTRGARAGADF
jgi:hypothetical protein